ncbi:MAG: hypothetical protein SFU85_13260 [Candidatus Methylacidiphilales bacterium]|nr:hypothetical protein [Candidatus Methylacidiphilales bacterium]
MEHLIQDGGTPGIEEFAQELGETLRSQYGGEAITGLQPFELLHFRTRCGYALRIFKEPDTGMYDAINKGISRAEGAILAYLNCDEQYLPDTLAVVADFFSGDAATDVLFGDALLTREDGSLLSYRRVVPPRALHIRLCHLGVWSCAMFYRRKVAEAGHRFPVEWKAIGDAVFVHGVMHAGFRVAVLPKPLATFAMGEGNLGQTPGALAEARQWRTGMGWRGGLLRPFVKAAHWLEKGFAGAYRRRHVDYALYTPLKPGQRSAFVCRNVSWRWKGSR